MKVEELFEQVQDGEYHGKQSGYSFVSDDGMVKIKTPAGVRGMNIECTVTVKNGKIIKHSLPGCIRESRPTLDENIVAVLNPLIGGDHQGAPFTAGEIINAIHDAKVNEKPETIKKAIKMLDLLIDYVTTLSHGKSKVTITGIENIKTALKTLLDK